MTRFQDTRFRDLAMTWRDTRLVTGFSVDEEVTGQCHKRRVVAGDSNPRHCGMTWFNGACARRRVCPISPRRVINDPTAIQCSQLWADLSNNDWAWLRFHRLPPDVIYQRHPSDRQGLGRTSLRRWCQCPLAVTCPHYLLLSIGRTTKTFHSRRKLKVNRKPRSRWPR